MRSRTAAVVMLLLAATAAAEPACRREADGRVSCDAEGFATLTRATLSAQAQADECAARLDGVRDQLDARSRELAACEAEPPVEPAVAPKPVGPSTMQLVGFALGVIGAGIAGAASAVLANDGLSTPPILASLAGAGAVLAGVVVLSW